MPSTYDQEEENPVERNIDNYVMCRWVPGYGRQSDGWLKIT